LARRSHLRQQASGLSVETLAEGCAVSMILTTGSNASYAAALSYQSFRRDPNPNPNTPAPAPRTTVTTVAPKPVEGTAAATVDGGASAYLTRYDGVARGLADIPLPVRADGSRPIVTPEQQRTIDRIAEKYAPNNDISGMIRELWANGVHPAQIAEKAEFWVLPTGQTVSATGQTVRQAVKISA
jgi:hypothetical protein